MNIKLLLGIITGLVVGAAGTAGVVATMAPEDIDARFGGADRCRSHRYAC